MSILIKEAYANSNTPLWNTGQVVSTPVSTVGTGGGMITSFYTWNSNTTYDLYEGPNISYLPGMYLATIGIGVSFQGHSPEPVDSQNISLFIEMSFANSDEATDPPYRSGIQYYYDAEQTNNQDAILTLQMPFHAIGDDSDNLRIKITPYSLYSNTSWNITTYSESIQYVSPDPVIQPSIFVVG